MSLFSRKGRGVAMVLFAALFLFGIFATTTLAQNISYTPQGERSIQDLLCAPTNSAHQDLVTCINRGYRFIVAIASLAGVMLLVWAGYLYMFGGEESVHTAKAMLGSTVGGIIIILITFVFLRQINPDIVKFKPIQPPDIFSNISKLDCSQMSAEQRANLGFRPDCSGAPGSGGNNNTGSGGAGGSTDVRADRACDKSPNNCQPFTDGGVACAPGLATCKGQNDLVKKLGEAQQTLGRDVRITVISNTPKQEGHSNPCHGFGSCVDIGISPNTIEAVSRACDSIKKSGLAILNEYKQFRNAGPVINNCGQYFESTGRTGDHLHIYFAK